MCIPVATNDVHVRILVMRGCKRMITSGVVDFGSLIFDDGGNPRRLQIAARHCDGDRAKDRLVALTSGSEAAKLISPGPDVSTKPGLVRWSQPGLFYWIAWIASARAQLCSPTILA